MGSFLSEEDLLVANKVGRYVLVLFSTIYLAVALLMFNTGNYYPFYVNLFLAFLYIYVFLNMKRLNLNHIVYTIHLVCIVYAIFMVLYFGWNYGAQYFLIPCIAFCYVGQFDNKKTVYFLAILESIIFELLYLFMEVKGYSFNTELVVFNQSANGIFYIIHSLIACFVIMIVMYFLKIKANKVIEKKEIINEALNINASTDPLTYLLNRWAFMEKIHLIEYKKPFHFAIIDIDFFKKVNDTYGHSLGDEVLRIAASCIKANFSKYTDMIARWGGEEFLILAFGCSEEEFYKACDNFRNDFNQTKLCGGELKVSASVGCLHINKDFYYTDFDTYIKNVDELLYNAKNSGRNKVIVSKI